MAQRNASDEWRLGLELGEPHRLEPAGPVAAARSDLSRDRLARPLYVFTWEHLGWLAVTLYALATRLIPIAVTPMDPSAADAAVRELDFLRAGVAALNSLPSTWAHFVAAALMSALGPSDFSARLIFALAGLAMIAAAFAMRTSLGRAGALALAALIALSPSTAYLSRASGVTVALAMALIAIAIASRTRRGGFVHAAILGIVLGLMLAGDPVGLPTAAMFLVALLVVGLFYLATAAHSWTRARVWWRSNAPRVGVCIVFAIGVWLCLTSNLFTRPVGQSVLAQARASWRGAGIAGYAGGIALYVPLLGFYEFEIAILGILGAILLLALRIRSALAGWCLVWACLSCAFYLWIPARTPDRVLAMLLPLALLGAFAIDYLHHAGAWRVIRYPLAVLALLTVYVCVLTAFVHPAPDIAEAPWARHALLFWSQPATTTAAPQECAAAVRIAGAAGNPTVVLDGGEPMLAWYLRALTPVTDRSRAAVLAGVAPADKGQFQTREVDATVVWKPDLSRLDPATAFRFLFTARAWSPLSISQKILYVNPTPRPPAQSQSTPHTLILTPTGTGATPTPQPSASAIARPTPTTPSRPSS